MMNTKAEIEKSGKRKQRTLLPFPLSRFPAFRFACL
jgi:hypothetical protein